MQSRRRPGLQDGSNEGNVEKRIIMASESDVLGEIPQYKKGKNKMEHEIPVGEISTKVEELRKQAQKLYDVSDDFPALNRNVMRILASIKMLQINVEEP